jgi:hypothetical protein
MGERERTVFMIAALYTGEQAHKTSASRLFRGLRRNPTLASDFLFQEGRTRVAPRLMLQHDDSDFLFDFLPCQWSSSWSFRLSRDKKHGASSLEALCRLSCQLWYSLVPPDLIRFIWSDEYTVHRFYRLVANVQPLLAYWILYMALHGIEYFRFIWNDRSVIDT